MEVCRIVCFYLSLLKMAASLIPLAATAAVVAGNHVPRITMEHFLFVTLTAVTYRLNKCVYAMRDYYSLVWYGFVDICDVKYADK